MHREVLDFKHIEDVSEPMRELIENLWPELLPKLPPKANCLLSRPRFWDKAAPQARERSLARSRTSSIQNDSGLPQGPADPQPAG